VGRARIAPLHLWRGYSWVASRLTARAGGSVARVQRCECRSEWEPARTRQRPRAQVLRQVAIAAGLGPARPAPERRSRRLRPKQGAQGDDVVGAPGAPGAGLRLRLPARFAHGTVKAAAWQARRPPRLRPRHAGHCESAGAAPPCSMAFPAGGLRGARRSGSPVPAPALAEAPSPALRGGRPARRPDPGPRGGPTRAHPPVPAQVLAEAGAEGLPVGAIAERVQTLGLRDMRTSKAPKASVVAALSADAVFARVAPGTYALQSLAARVAPAAGGGAGAAAAAGGARARRLARTSAPWPSPARSWGPPGPPRARPGPARTQSRTTARAAAAATRAS